MSSGTDGPGGSGRSRIRLFILEGIAMAVVGTLLQFVPAPDVVGTLGTAAFFVGVVTSVLGVVAHVVVDASTSP